MLSTAIPYHLSIQTRCVLCQTLTQKNRVLEENTPKAEFHQDGSLFPLAGSAYLIPLPGYGRY